ncbi:hypothetical protein RvY_10041-2 [Ramazzottius varieornatus]|uniref:Uncharacterized protein n=1 Tax=Ramazzottius varieornatus TaxID=947166 RepID=A0A1D1VBG5_RAMVA|nr:hypothetical protein RvY_10041-2 [Ramazzottius varieornatus]
MARKTSADKFLNTKELSVIITRSCTLFLVRHDKQYYVLLIHDSSCKVFLQQSRIAAVVPSAYPPFLSYGFILLHSLLFVGTVRHRCMTIYCSSADWLSVLLVRALESRVTSVRLL